MKPPGHPRMTFTHIFLNSPEQLPQDLLIFQQNFKSATVGITFTLTWFRFFPLSVDYILSFL